MLYFLQGLTMGLAYVAPIGLQNLFVINTALSASRPRAFGTAAIVIFFDITLALACFFGIGAYAALHLAANADSVGGQPDCAAHRHQPAAHPNGRPAPNPAAPLLARSDFHRML